MPQKDCPVKAFGKEGGTGLRLPEGRIMKALKL